ncbi:MAG: ABC transporter ATP-binding protein [Chitinophagales bacterium]|nr:ABC transporter ATP-binding protein [Chitinophagales bacterium]
MLLVKNIAKSFKTITAVEDVSFHVERGMFYGLLGPNGAGKTTTINMISAILPPDKGSMFADGKNIYENTADVKRMMGIVPQEIALYDDLSAYANLLFWGSLYGIKGNDAKRRADQLLEWVGLSDRKKHLIKTYSGGMKRRINIANALMHDPALIIMDEPTVGIDPQSRNNIYALLQDLHTQGKTILYTTHYIEEAEKMCDKIGIIDKGKIIAEGTLQELKTKNDMEESIVISFDEKSYKPAALPGYTIHYAEGKNEMTIFSKNINHDLSEVIKKCAEAGVIINNIDIRHINLETVFLNLTGRQLRDE